jgi:hypothetical protein
VKFVGRLNATLEYESPNLLVFVASCVLVAIRHVLV